MSRSATETDSRTAKAAARTSATDGRGPSPATTASASSRDWRGRAGASRPMATPAMVACTPDSRVASHTKTPTATYAGMYQTWARFMPCMTTRPATAHNSHPTERSSV